MDLYRLGSDCGIGILPDVTIDISRNLNTFILGL